MMGNIENHGRALRAYQHYTSGLDFIHKYRFEDKDIDELEEEEQEKWDQEVSKLLEIIECDDIEIYHEEDSIGVHVGNGSRYVYFDGWVFQYNEEETPRM